MSRNEKEKEQEKGGEEEEEKDECCICLGEIGEVMGCLTCCEHKFCFGCISQWAEKSNTCPLCKQRFREIIRKTVGGQQGRKKQKTERVRVRRKDYNPWSEEEDEDDSDDDDLDDEDLHWPPSGFLIDSFSLGSMHAPPLYNHHHAHHHHHHHAHQHNSGFPFSFVTQPHVHHAMGLFDMFHRLMFDTARSSYAPHGHGHSTSTYASSSSGDELLSEPSSPEVILVDSDGEDTSSLERGRTRREQRTAAADIPAPLALPRPRLPAGPAQEVIDLTLLPDSEDDGDDDDETEADVARRLRRGGREQGEPLPTVVVNLEASPGPQVREFARRSGGRIADIIHEQDI